MYLPDKLSFTYDNLRGKEYDVVIGFDDNNAFVKSYVETIKDNVNNREYEFTSLTCPSVGKKWDKDNVSYLTNKLKDAIELLNRSAYKPFPVSPGAIKFFEPGKEYAMESRELLNDLHRGFAFCYLSDWTSWTAPYNCKNNLFNKVNSLEEYKKAVGDVNELVHELEGYYYTEAFTNRILDTYTEHCLSFKNAPWRFLEPHENVYRVSDLGCDVWVPMQHMVGKNYMSCYYDLDDPTTADIHHENNLYGALSIGTRSTLASPHLRMWFKEYGMEPQLGIPLGSIIEGGDVLHELQEWTTVQTSQIKNLKFI